MGIVQMIAPRGSRRRRWGRRLMTATYGRWRGGRLALERAALRRSWAGRRADDLDEYLVSGYQNPRINAQSMLLRHFLVRKLFGAEFDPLMREELRFCVDATEAIRRRAAELGVTMGSYLDPAKRAAVQAASRAVADREDTYERRWAEALAGRTAGPLRVLEFACGSANDYRFLHSYGIARFLDYTGVDLTSANIDNARARFPDVHFEVGNVLELSYPDRSYDYVVVSDLFEHLSLEAMEQAIDQASRLARRGVVFTFFSMADQPAHEVHPKGSYHWNVLSAPLVRRRLAADFDTVTSVHVHGFLRREFGYRHGYNKRAWTMTAERVAAIGPS
jgi:ubiquinone/menaquinone biosynthesis C-methylase UbiE